MRYGYVAADAALSKDDMPNFMGCTMIWRQPHCHFPQNGRSTMEKGYNSHDLYIAKKSDKVKQSDRL